MESGLGSNHSKLGAGASAHDMLTLAGRVEVHNLRIFSQDDG